MAVHQGHMCRLAQEPFRSMTKEVRQKHMTPSRRGGANKTACASTPPLHRRARPEISNVTAVHEHIQIHSMDRTSFFLKFWGPSNGPQSQKASSLYAVSGLSIFFRIK